MTSSSPKLSHPQRKAAQWLARTRRGAVIAPAGSGKTIIAAAALDMAIAAKPRPRPPVIGWLANTVEQCQQARAALDKFPHAAKADVRVACAAAGAAWHDCDLLIVDECHHVLAPTWRQQVDTCRNAVWGMTATPPENAEAFAEVFAETHEIGRHELTDRLCPAEVCWLTATDDCRAAIEAKIERDMFRRRPWWRGSEEELWAQVAWQACVEIGIVGNRARNAAALEAAKQHTEPTLILVNTVEHALDIAKLLPSCAPCFSKMGRLRRAKVLADFAAGKVQRIVATSLADEGLDVPNASVLVLVSAGRSYTKTVQRTGRVLRVAEGKTTARIYDFADTCHPLMAKHARRRGEIYRSLGYKTVDSVAA